VPADPEQIKREIEDLRSELADTVEELSARVTPKAVAGQSVVATKRWFGLPTAAGAGASIRWERVGGVVGVFALLILKRRFTKSRKAKKRAKG
jgi:hypothetical protein